LLLPPTQLPELWSRLAGMGVSREFIKQLAQERLLRGRINEWTSGHQATFDQIDVSVDQETEYRAFCGKLNFLILPVEGNIEIKTLLKRISDGQ